MLNEILDMSLENCVLFLHGNKKFDREKYMITVLDSDP